MVVLTIPAFWEAEAGGSLDQGFFWLAQPAFRAGLVRYVKLGFKPQLNKCLNN